MSTPGADRALGEGPLIGASVLRSEEGIAVSKASCVCAGPAIALGGGNAKLSFGAQRLFVCQAPFAIFHFQQYRRRPQ